MKLEVMDNGLSEYELVDESGETVAYMALAGDAEQAREVAKRVNNHERLVEALKLSMLGLEAMIEDGRCGDTFTATALHLDNCNALLAALEAGKGGE